MNKLTLLSILLPLAGCAGTVEKSAELKPASAVVAVDQTNASVSQAVTTVSQVDAGKPAAAVQDPLPNKVASVSASTGKAAPKPDTELSGWDELSRRLLAWGDPMRRSMEQYCPPATTTRNP
jgi:hypothetical protein